MNANKFRSAYASCLDTQARDSEPSIVVSIDAEEATSCKMAPTVYGNTFPGEVDEDRNYSVPPHRQPLSGGFTPLAPHERLTLKFAKIIGDFEEVSADEKFLLLLKEMSRTLLKDIKSNRIGFVEGFMMRNFISHIITSLTLAQELELLKTEE